MSSNVLRIKEKLSIVDVVSAYIKITKAGKNFKGRCPFHNEKTPSFFVSPDRDAYYCFGCGRGGDIFTFVEEFEGLDFLGAMKVLADKAGVEISFNADSMKKEDKATLYEILEESTKFYEELLSKNKEALKYLKERGLSDEIIKSFRLGFALPGWHNLLEHLKTKGFKESDLKKAGVIGESKSKLYDLFRERIIFPINDSAGRVVAFTGRVFGSNDSDAKYINSPETELYDKSKILFGFEKAKFGIRKHDFCILVEGNTDVIMAHQAGYRNTVAVSGTSLTDAHLEAIRRLTTKIVFAFDSDGAGFKASGRGAKKALLLGIDLKVANLPQGKDPADVIKEDVNVWKDAIKNSKHIVDYYLNLYEQNIPDKRKYALTVREEVLPYILMIENKIDQSHFIKKVAQRLEIEEGVLKLELEKIELNQADILTSESLEEKEREKEKTRLDEVKKRITGILVWKLGVKDNDFVDRYKKKLKDIIESDITEEYSDKEKNNLATLAEFSFEGSDNIEKEMDELVLNFEEDFLKEKLLGIMNNIKKSEKDSNNELEEYLSLYQKISKRLEDIKKQRS